MPAFSGDLIGVDESGKGDFFGPLVVSAFFCREEDLPRLEALGVRDSKKVSDKRAMEIDEVLKEEFVYATVVLLPSECNRAYSQIRNLNKLLAQGHASAITGLIQQLDESGQKADLAVSDKFGKDERLETAMASLDCRIPVKQIVRGESIPQVAAASIIARAEFLRNLKELSVPLGLSLPKGAGAPVDVVGRKITARFGTERLGELAKTHFKNFQRSIIP